MPRCTHRTQIGGLELAPAADGAQEDASESGTDVDCDAHDYTADGVLPEALTTLFSVKTGPQKEAQLASDWGEIDKEVGLANIRCRYPKRLTFLHKVDAQGDRATTYAMVLLPVDEAEGVNTATLKESIMMTSGTYTEVPVAIIFTKFQEVCHVGEARHAR